MEKERLFILKETDRLKDGYEKFLFDICSIESPSKDKEAVDAVNSFICSFAAAKGYEVKRFPFEGCGDMLCIDLNPGAEKSLYLLAHTDTVHDKGAFGAVPVRTEGRIMKGPGVVDCKGGIAEALLAMEVLKNAGYQKNVRLVLNGEEETSGALGGEREKSLIRDTASGYRYAVCCEVGRLGKILVARRGIMHFRIDVRGKASHARISYFDGVSAVREAAYKIIEIEKLSRPGGVTFNCGVINGGDKFNIVPENCSFLIDVRVMSDEDAAFARQSLREIASRSFVEGSASVLTESLFRHPMNQTPANRRLAEKISGIYESVGGERLEPSVSGGGSDAAYTVEAGVPTVCAFGVAGEFCHTDREYALLDTLSLRAKTLALLCAGI